MLPEIYGYLTACDFTFTPEMVTEFCLIGMFGIEFQTESTLSQANACTEAKKYQGDNDSNRSDNFGE